VPVIEDAAHALPTRSQGRLVGTLSDITCFSFYATKNITTGEGGMAVTANPVWAERMKLMHLHGMSRDAWKRYTQQGSWSYEILAPGFKYNLTDMAAAIGIEQLKKCDAFHQRRRAIADRYDVAFANVPGIRTPQVADRDGHGWHLYIVQVDPAQIPMGRDAFIRELTARNIGTSVHFIPLHIQPYYRDRYSLRPEEAPNAIAAYQGMVSLPLYAKMSDADVEDVIEAVQDVALGVRS
jgi:perosamine synthetase